MKSARWFVSYIAVAFVGLGLAFAISLRFLAPAHSQGTNLEAPSAGDLPPEFLNEVNKTQVPSTTPLPEAKPAATAPVLPQKNGTAPAPPTALAPSTPETIGSDDATAPAPTAMGVSPDGYVYDPTGRRDPFAPYRALVSGVKNTENAPLDPLQRWDLDKLKVIGILWEVRSPRAMLKDPDGNVHTIVKNAKIGRNNGYVVAIREGEVVVVESFEVEGSTNRETKILELGK